MATVPTETGDGVRPFSLVVAVNDPDEMRENLMRSPCLQHGRHELIAVDNVGNRASANMGALYVAAAARAAHDLVLFAHQDLLFPEDFDGRLAAALTDLERDDPDWGVVGSAGVDLEGGAYVGHWCDPGGKRRTDPLPQRVQVLDELWLGVRRSRGPTFDADLPGFHCYGADVCLAARSAGRHCYALDAFCWHKHRDPAGAVITARDQSPKIVQRDSAAFRAEFALCRDALFAKWRARMPAAIAALEDSIWLQG